MESSENKNILIGNFLIANGFITEEYLREALDLQKDNKGQVLGEILVTIGALSKEDLIMAMEAYILQYETEPSHIDEWLDQDEIDMLLEKMNSNHK